MKSKIKRWLQASSAVGNEFQFKFSIPDGKAGLKVGIFLVLVELLILSFWLSTNRASHYLALPSYETSRPRERRINMGHHVAEELLGAVSTSDTTLVNESSLIRRRHPFFHESNDD